METLASVWAHDPRDLSDPCSRQCVPRSAWDAPGELTSSPPAGGIWAQQLSPHILRNKQLQDTLLQREEELARLQRENNKLREFLTSSFVRNLEEKAKRLGPDGRMKLKRHVSPSFLESPRVSKRVCRNLTAEFSSSNTDSPTASERNLDLWVLRTLGLKDRDTIDLSSDLPSSAHFVSPSSSSEYGLSSSPCCPPVFSCPSASSELVLNSPIVPFVSNSPSIHGAGHCHSTLPVRHSEYSYGGHANLIKSSESTLDNLVQRDTNPVNQLYSFTATGLMGQYGASHTEMSTVHCPPSHSLPLSPFPVSAERLPMSPLTTGNPTENSIHSPQLQNISGHPQNLVQISPIIDGIPFSPVPASSPVPSHAWVSAGVCTPTKHCHAQTGTSTTRVQPQTPSSRTDLAFSVSLTSSSSVKTHSFPQGQAFVQKDTEGGWKFTWMPKHRD